MVSKIAQQFTSAAFCDAEQKLATEIFSSVAHDTGVKVRKALAENVKSCAFLPRAVALSLAADVEEVSLPAIEFSQVLADEDLVRIVQGGNTRNQ